MAVVREFALPDLGEGLTEAEIVRWLVAVGDVVAVDQPVVEVETAKAMVEVPCPYGGVVTARFGEEGSELPVGAALLTVAVGDPSEGPESGTDGTGPAGAADPTGSGPAGVRDGDGGVDAPARGGEGDSEGSGNVLVGYGTGAPAARRRRLRAAPLGTSARRATEAVGAGAGTVGAQREGGADTAAAATATAVAGAATTASTRGSTAGGGGASGGTDGGASGDTDGDAQASGRPTPVISPLVRRLAREHRLDLGDVVGSGRDGLILRSDVERAIARMTVASSDAQRSERERAEAGTDPSAWAASTSAAARGTVASPERQTSAQVVGASGALARGGGLAGAREAERIPLRGVRGAVAEKLSRSRREIPEATCWVDADATELLAARAAMNAAGDPKVSLLAVLARICTAALARYPELNSTVDTEAREIVRLPEVHLGFAAQTDRGLMVPVVRDAHLRDAVELSAEFARLTESARAGRLTPAELTGGTFTLNNYGVFGVDGSTPIINHPEAAMLGVGRIADRPWVHRGELAVRRVVQLSLTFDHRVCDGGTAGGFLRYVADCVEQPAVLLRTV
ncbi:dihydrolipoamide acetyltransferase family protein [Streptomyces buecherae]|uniref:Dihydrolipoamide acetyltransferase component of pyruvate dehydrogenase complex n=1 Tax=Streptomyces buecherae TaxID=2763006 RepID=A0A7H8N9X6_9ACTN|nr:dihydrolipoamide acetyltransferase family protein [Streptomyces buecherae]QKW51245.1 2-oxo acid dehydrogenase subunit E2 [Streptomyces buecherae]